MNGLAADTHAAIWPRSHALRGNAVLHALRAEWRGTRGHRRRASRTAFPRRAWERVKIEVYSEPSGPSADPGYRRFETLRPGQTLAGEIGNATTGPAALAPIPVEAFFAPV
jgi:hypothetical protein